MKQHGFARRADFELVEATKSTLTYRLQASETTRLQYPFDFVLTRQYQLLGGVLEVHTEVVNSSKQVMPFSIGEHPGFSLAWGVGDQIEDYRLEFEKAETIDTTLLDSNHLVSRTTERVLTNEQVLPLRRDLFDRDALIFLKLASRKISLCSCKHKNRLTVEFPGYPYLGIWAKPGAPYVCIEPWYGHADTAWHDGQLKHKAGIIQLNAGETFSCLWRVSVVDG